MAWKNPFSYDAPKPDDDWVYYVANQTKDTLGTALGSMFGGIGAGVTSAAKTLYSIDDSQKDNSDPYTGRWYTGAHAGLDPITSAYALGQNLYGPTTKPVGMSSAAPVVSNVIESKVPGFRLTNNIGATGREYQDTQKDYMQQANPIKTFGTYNPYFKQNSTFPGVPSGQKETLRNPFTYDPNSTRNTMNVDDRTTQWYKAVDYSSGVAREYWARKPGMVAQDSGLNQMREWLRAKSLMWGSEGTPFPGVTIPKDISVNPAPPFVEPEVTTDGGYGGYYYGGGGGGGYTKPKPSWYMQLTNWKI